MSAFQVLGSKGGGGGDGGGGGRDVTIRTFLIFSYVMSSPSSKSYCVVVRVIFRWILRNALPKFRRLLLGNGASRVEKMARGGRLI